jgi:hypothetical protein
MQFEVLYRDKAVSVTSKDIKYRFQVLVLLLITP